MTIIHTKKTVFGLVGDRHDNGVGILQLGGEWLWGGRNVFNKVGQVTSSSKYTQYLCKARAVLW